MKGNVGKWERTSDVRGMEGEDEENGANGIICLVCVGGWWGIEYRDAGDVDGEKNGMARGN